MIEAGVMRGRRRSAEAFPGVEAEVVVIVPRGKEGCAVAKSGHQIEAQYSTIELQRAIEAAHFQVHVADTGAGGNLISHFSWRGECGRSIHLHHLGCGSVVLR